jgi:hypothetical protein
VRRVFFLPGLGRQGWFMGTHRPVLSQADPPMNFRFNRLASTWRLTASVVAVRAGLIVLLLTGGATGLRAQDKFDQDDFLSRKKWYVTFTLSLKGKGVATRLEGSDRWSTKWDILREVNGTFELDDVGQNGTRSSTLAQGERYQGRYISWDVDTGLSSVNYLVADRVEHNSETDAVTGAATEATGFTKFAGAGSTKIGRTKELKCDLKDRVFDFDFGGLRNWNREPNAKPLKLTGEYHDKTPATRGHHDIVHPLEEFGIFGMLPEIMPLQDQLLRRPLVLKQGKINFTVSVPVVKLPSFPFHRGSIPGGSEKFNQWTTEGGPPLTLSLEVSISPTPPSRARLVLEPEASYRSGDDSWRPLCSASESKAGNSLKVNWRIEEEGGDPAKPTKISRVVFSLLNTSKEPGVCMNYPLQPMLPADFDLKFASGAESSPAEERASDGQKLKLTSTKVDARKGTIAVDCFDSGATGVLVAEAELEDGRVVKATIGDSSESQLMIPDFEPGVSWIATGWRNKHAAGKKDDADDEDFPKGDGQRGDGLTVWEEYRGFWVGGRWDGDCDPKTKDLFVDNPLRGVTQGGIWMFASITELRIHDLLTKDEHRADRVFNFNRGSRPHLVDQHCLVIAKGGLEDKTEGAAVAAASLATAVSGVDFPGPPKNTKEVSYLSIMLVPPLDRAEVEAKLQRFARVDWAICHELGHGLGIRHHGDKDGGFSTWTFHKNAAGEPINTINGKDVIVKDEQTGKFMIPTDFMSPLTEGKPWEIWIGEPNGQMSGNDTCVMRYVLPSMYRSKTDPNVFYFFRNEDKFGNRLCSSPEGTGVNLASRKPQARYGDADQGRGDCAHKFVVSDHWDKIQ